MYHLRQHCQRWYFSALFQSAIRLSHPPALRRHMGTGHSRKAAECTFPRCLPLPPWAGVLGDRRFRVCFQGICGLLEEQRPEYLLEHFWCEIVSSSPDPIGFRNFFCDSHFSCDIRVMSQYHHTAVRAFFTLTTLVCLRQGWKAPPLRNKLLHSKAFDEIGKGSHDTEIGPDSNVQSDCALI